ncbi:MAG: NYN domain-containing protein [Acidobacteria bacterium]|nr:MAG: NYN domain-containing protein [Acidobacteriota bacterium]
MNSPFEQTSQVEQPRRIKTALFVDFDNIYVGLDKIDPEAAQSFATYPARWLAWIEQGMPSRENGASAQQQQRAILIRRCYLNPKLFYNFRPYFTRSAFSVVDCPPITQRGKNSTDIQMVMDILDLMNHPTRFDEFIILSGDSDFTPVLLRLRAHDRRTAILTIGPIAPAYRAASDLVVSSDSFIEDGLGMLPIVLNEASAPAPPEPTPSPYEPVLEVMAQKVYDGVLAEGELPATSLVFIFKTFPEFTASDNWLGFSSLRYLTLELIRRRPALRMVDGDPWRVVLAATADELAPTTDAPVEVPALETDETEPPPVEPQAEANASDAQLREQIIERVRQFVSNSLEPVDMARAAFDVIRTFGPQVTETEWAGTGSFKQLLQGAAPLDFEIVTAPNQPGYLYDPARHAPPFAADATVTPLPDKLDRLAPALADFVRRVSQVSGAPRLTPEEYALVFTAITNDLSERPFNLTYTSKAVRDYCLERGAAIPRKSVWFILQGITFTGHRFGKDPEQDESAHLAQVFRDDVLKLCEDAGLELSTDERQLLDDWLMRGWTGAPQTRGLLRVNDEPLELPTPLTAESVEAPEPITTPLD